MISDPHPPAQVVQGNGGEDKADGAGGKLDWSSPETAERKDAGEISGERRGPGLGGGARE